VLLVTLMMPTLALIIPLLLEMGRSDGSTPTRP
jgi:preprotein translocase subunit SecG